MIMRCLAIACLFIAQTAYAQTVLFDETAGTLPAAQGWLTYIVQGSATQTYLTNQGVQLVTDNATQAGYFNRNLFTGTLVNPAFPVLQRNPGFAVRFDLTVTSEAHLNNDRAGFSVIALASDGMGIELGFWANEIWAQNDTPLFTHGEGIVRNTTSPTSYLLSLVGNSYQLVADGSPILNGALRNYSSFGFPPYTYTSFLFLGDDTTSASADVTLGRVTLLASVPEPASWMMMTVAVLIAGCCYRRWKRGNIQVA